ncbi:PilW family protein [Thalassotalea euphylliae]|uniref:Prepilin-type cleavage/methylation domain-containing protein n=1 Tax=Thalassotalea euphylliae TaxID=1655234 RepID=A0A3E0UCY8_9GAMM|nr:PilW family protein [Thalassotalea euphylliae]REL34766.1 prepilin-type cleavage/methylation domain-containing protein [Thalassotalea euphylliae]
MKYQRGFTILEIFISLALGLVLFSGVMSIFVGMYSTSDTTTRYGSMQETGRITISLLTDDLMRQGFWGELAMPLSNSNLLAVPAAPSSECRGGGINNGTFPGNIGTFRAIWGATPLNSAMMGCINDAKQGSDILQLKRAVALPTVGALDDDRYYLTTNMNAGQIFDGENTPPVINNSQTWEYQHHIYYVSDDTLAGSSNVVPTLNLISLANSMWNQPLIDGVEMIRFLYGIDSDGNGNVDSFVSANNVTDAIWDGASSAKIRAVKVYVLVRDIELDPTYTNDTVYRLGDVNFNAAGDNYRRMLFSSTITLHNGDVRVW